MNKHEVHKRKILRQILKQKRKELKSAEKSKRTLIKEKDFIEYVLKNFEGFEPTIVEKSFKDFDPRDFYGCCIWVVLRHENDDVVLKQVTEYSKTSELKIKNIVAHERIDEKGNEVLVTPYSLLVLQQEDQHFRLANIEAKTEEAKRKVQRILDKYLQTERGLIDGGHDAYREIFKRKTN